MVNNNRDLAKKKKKEYQYRDKPVVISKALGKSITISIKFSNLKESNWDFYFLLT